MQRLPGLALLLPLAFWWGEDPLERARDAFRRQDWAAAERECQAAIRGDPRDARAQELLGMVYAARQEFARAEEPFRQACALKPKEGLACYYLGRNYYALGRYTESRQILEKELERAPHSDRIRTGLGLTLEALGALERAERLLQGAAAGGSADAQSEYGQFLFRQGRLEEAARVLRASGNKDALERVNRQLAAAAGTQAAGTTARVQFTASELPMVVQNGGSGDKHQIETMIAGVAVLDYDGDGWPDLYLCNGATVPQLEKSDARYHNRLLRNNRDGTFTDVTREAGVAGRGYSMGVAAGDFDNDGRPDLYVTGVRENTLYRNRGDGTFTDVTARAGVGGGGLWAVAAGWFDYDGDGWLDLLVVRYVAWDPGAEPYCGDRRPGFRAYCHPKYYRALPNALYHNQGDGTFRDVSAESGIGAAAGKGMGVVFADYDHDGRPDIFIANDTVPNFLFHNLGGGKFEEVGEAKGVAFNGDGRAVSSMGAEFRDYDNDGWDDLFVTALSNEGFTLFRNLGGKGFAETTQAARIAGPSLLLAGWSTGMFDFNNDGWKDLFVANGHADDNVEKTSSLESRQANCVFVNRGDGRFDFVPLAGKALHRGAAVGDFNRDGKLDVVVTRLNEPALLLTNTTTEAGHWLGVRLRGHRSNREGMGARVRVRTAAGTQWSQVTTSGGYAASHEAMAHFGLGASKAVEEVEIVWPSGQRQTLRDVTAGQVLVVEEQQQQPPPRQ